VTSSKTRRKALFTDGVLWLTCLLVALLFLLPKTVNLIQVREQERIEAHQAAIAEQKLKESQLRIEYLGSDPDAIKKIDEQRALNERIQNND
jgi:hypothetical protein